MDKKTAYEGIGKLFLVVMILIIGVFLLIPSISASEWDQIKDYNPIDRSVTVSNSFLKIVELGDIAKVTPLTPHINQVFHGKNQLVAEFEIESYLVYTEKVWDGMKFLDIKNGNSEVERKFVLRYSTIDESYGTKQECIGTGKIDAKNQTETLECHDVVDYDNIIKTKIWHDLDVNADLPKGKINIGIFADVEAGDYIEFVPTWFGVEMPEYSIWDDTWNVGLVAYWNMNDTTENVNGIYNLTSNEGTVTYANTNCLSGKCGQFSSENNLKTVANNVLTLNGTSTINFIVYDDGSLTSDIIYFNMNVGATDMVMGHRDGAGSQKWYFRDNIIGVQPAYTSPTGKGHFMVTITTNSSGKCIYINATLKGCGGVNNNYGANTYWILGAWGTGEDLTGTIDEVGYWNLTLTPTQVLNLYTAYLGGASYTDTPFTAPMSVYVNLIYPTDNFNISVATQMFSANHSITNGNLTNTTLELSNNSGLVYSNFTTSFDSLNRTNLTISDIPDGTYKWNYYTCGNNETGSNCTYTTNRTITIDTVTYGQSGNSSLGEGSTATFSLIVNSTSLPIGDASANLWYAGVNKGTTTKNVLDANRIQFITSFVLSSGTGNLTGKNNSWYWNYNTTRVSTRNTTTQYQIVYNVSITDCSTTTGRVILNMSLKDEELNEFLNATSPNLNNIEIDLQISSWDNSSVYWEFSKKWINNQSVAICVPNGLLNSSSYKIDFTVGYDGTDHVREFYYMDNGTLDNSHNFNSYTDDTVDLLDLLTADSTTFLFEFTDTDNLQVDEAIVHTFRKYIGEGAFREVERSKQDNNGQTHVHLVEEDVIYYFMVTQYGVIIYTSDTYNAKCLSTPCEISLSASATEQNWSIIDNEGGDYSVTTNRNTRVVTTTFSIGAIDLVNATLYKIINGTSTIINQSSLTATSGTITMSVPLVYGNATYFIAIYRNNTFIKSVWVDLTERGQDYFGTFGAILGGLIVVAMMLMAVSEGAGFIVFTILALIVISIMKLVDLGWLALISIICAGAVIIWKLVNRRGSQQ